MAVISGDERINAVNHQAGLLATAEGQCERGYARLGWMLLEVAELQLWRVQHETFRDYLRAVAMVSKRTVGQLHQYFLAVRDLSDTFTAEQLETMGITKALRLRQAKDYALVLPAILVNAALDPGVTAKELKKLISTTLRLPSDDDGDWLDLEFEFMVSPEERDTITDAINAAIHTDPLIKPTIARSAQMKEIALRWAMEYLSSHVGDGQ